MAVGRIICVALPFVLAVASIICMLAAGLAGVTSNSLYMFRVNTTDFQISTSSLTTALSAVTRRDELSDLASDASDLASSTSSSDAATASAAASAVDGTNVTAEDIPILYGYYDVTLWGYCFVPVDGKKNCSKGTFDWADKHLNTSSLMTSTGINVTIPDSIEDSLDVFKSVSKWTEVVYIIAMIALGAEIFFGFFTACSRGIACLTFLVSGVATLAVIGAAAMMTAMSVVVVGSVEATAKLYGVTSSFNQSFLACIWLGVAFALGAGLFWMFTICCCKPEKRARRSNKRHLDEQEKMLPAGAYAPIGDHSAGGSSNNVGGYNPQQYGVPRQQAGYNARTDLAYEPYSHSRV